jgi:hypothetical protein
MTLAAMAFHGVASSIGAWRRDVRRYARVARAGCNVAPLSDVRRPLPSTLFGDALMALCGDRLRSALETPYVAASNSKVEREPRPRMPDAQARASALNESSTSANGTNGATSTPRDWRTTEGPDVGERDASSRSDDIPRRDRQWTTGAERDESASDESVANHGAATTTRRARGRDEQDSVRAKRDVPSPLAVALQRLQRSSESAPTVSPTTRPATPLSSLSQHDALVSRETSHEDVTHRSPPALPATSAQQADEQAHFAPSASSSVAGRRPWWASGVDEIHSRNVQRTPVARPTSSAMEAPEEAFAEMLADVLRQQAIQHGVLVP